MIVQCSSCNTRFEVDDGMLLPAGRKLKCSNCKEIFFQPPPENTSQKKIDDEELEGDDDTATVVGPNLAQNLDEPSPDDGESLSDLESLIGEGADEESPLEEEEPEENGPQEDIGITEGFDEEISADMEEAEEAVEEEVVEEVEETVEEEIVEDVEEAVEEEAVEEVEEAVAVEKREDTQKGGDVLEGGDEEEVEAEEEKSSKWTLALPSAKLGWIATILLGMSLVAGVVGPTQWWEYQWFDFNSSFRLTGLRGDWRVHPFGTVLVVQGGLTNTDKMTQSVPKITITLLDSQNNELIGSAVLPGRVVEDKLLEETTEESLRAMIHLQADDKKMKVDRLWPGKESSFQAIFINPPPKAVRYRIDFDNQDKQATGTVRLRESIGK
ncbi:MAG: zinc-ribbon domain-containing protein [Nitrospirae bacterium]|nr:zinc-ribbon domain-containing protein [Magnetococcales bacterium]